MRAVIKFQKAYHHKKKMFKNLNRFQRYCQKLSFFSIYRKWPLAEAALRLRSKLSYDLIPYGNYRPSFSSAVSAAEN